MLGLAVFVLILLVLTLWATAALYIDCRLPWLRAPAAAVYLVAVVCVWVFFKRRPAAVGLTIVAFALVLVWWSTLKPSNEGHWQKEVAVLAYADIAGDKIVLHNIRNCDYRTETDFDVRYYDKTIALSQLRSLDLSVVYWGSPYIAHTMASFGFEGGDYICFSIETRKQEGQGYSAFKGLFRQFELIYVVGDERDLVRVRTNYRQGEEVYLYRLRVSQERARDFLLDYLRRLNSLQLRPEWYSALTQNCTTSIRSQRAVADRSPWDWRMLVNGYCPELLFDRGLINTNMPLAELKSRVHINDRARAAGKAADFSSQIRQGLPDSY
jgi:hypothetical protein